MLSRTTPAALVCPLAPFLAPRFLARSTRIAAAVAPCSTLHHGLARAGYATKPAKPRRKSRPLLEYTNKTKVDLANEHVPLMKQFQAACSIPDIPKILSLYPSILQSPLLTRNDTRRIAQALHTHLRSIGSSSSQSSAGVLPFLERFTQDLRDGAIPAHPDAYVHLLGIYKENKWYGLGFNLWQLLSSQEDSVDQAVYGAAIELLAYRGLDSLEALEELYVDGLKRFPGTFAEYHLSPDAVVPDRSRPTTISGMPMALLQGILTARILARDWKNAYLALDTALRLYPASTPSRFFELFMTERPLSEAYTVFLLACRSGVTLNPRHVTSLLVKLKTTMYKLARMSDRAMALRGMVNAIYAYAESGGSVQGPHISCLLHGWASLTPDKDMADLSVAETRMRFTAATTAHEMVSILIQAGMPAFPQAFVALIDLAGRYKVPELLHAVLEDIETARVDIGDIGRRVTLIEAGDIGDVGLIEKFWDMIAARAEQQGNPPDTMDWIALAKACRRAENPAYLHQQIQRWKHAIDSETEDRAQQTLAQRDRKPAHSFEPMPAADFESEMKEVLRISENIAAIIMSGQPLDLRKTPFPMFLDMNRESLGSPEDLAEVYETATTDPHQPVPDSDASTEVVKSSTGIPLAELRFENWVTVLELMKEAQVTEADLQRRIDEALASGQPLKDFTFPFSFTKATSASNADTSDPSGMRRPRKILLQQEVKRLRAPEETSSSPHKFYKSSAASDSIKVRAPQPKETFKRNPTQRYFVASKTDDHENRPTISHRPLARIARQALMKTRNDMQSETIRAESEKEVKGS